MRTLDARHSPAARGDSTVDALCGRAAELGARWPQLPRPLLLPWSEDPVLLLDRGVPWLYGPARRDPAAVASRAVLPHPQARRLRSFARLDLPITEVAVAHELAPTGPVAELIGVLASGPRTCTDEVARAVVGPVPPHPTLAATARLLASLVRTTALATTAGADALLDPIVFGVVGHEHPEHGELCLFYPLAAWRW